MRCRFKIKNVLIVTVLCMVCFIIDTICKKKYAVASVGKLKTEWTINKDGKF